MRKIDARNVAIRHYHKIGDVFETGWNAYSNALTSNVNHQLSIVVYETD